MNRNVLGLLALAAAILLTSSSQPTVAAQTANPAVPPPAPKKIELDLDKASHVTLPQLKQDLHAETFKTADGRSGWVVRVPGGRPIATPAYADGMIFVGGGYGSHEFYAFNAKTGALDWKISTSDDGPTAAVVAEGKVAFNTESCTIIVVDEKTGKLLWQEWLGDPLMSQPAIANGKLYIAFPAGQRGHKSTGSHLLLAADLATGKHLWEQPITADVISAPVISGNTVYLTCFDGTSFALDATTGKVLWTKQNAATSAPVIANGQVVVTGKDKEYEGIRALDGKGNAQNPELYAKSKADYLNSAASGGVALNKQAQTTLDASVGFGNAPGSANLGAASKNVGVTSVVGGWAYQGSKVVYANQQLLNAQGHTLNALTPKGEMNWQAEARGKEVNDRTQVFSPPALGRQQMYLSTAFGHLLSVRQKDGVVQFNYAFGQPMVFQPALAEGNVYAGTSNGMIICLMTGSSDADGWYAWGGNAQHNKN